MALDQVLEDLLKLVPGPEADAARKVFETSPALAKEIKESSLRQSDYSRKMNELDGERNKFAGEKKTMVEWYDRNKGRHEQLMNDYTTAQSTITDLRSQLEKAGPGDEAEGDSKVDEATLNARVDARLREVGGYASKTELQKMIAQEAEKIADERVKAQTTKFLTETWPAATEIQNRINEAQWMAMQEFGKPLSQEQRKEVAELMQERNIMDPVKAYEAWAKPQRDKIEFDKKVKEEVASQVSKMNFPGVSGPALADMGPVQQARSGQLPKLPDHSIIGDGAAAAAAAAELRGEGKF